ncbi:MAG: hypothetical protein Kow00121_62050 [Elainellaceae cyanobacterium]
MVLDANNDFFQTTDSIVLGTPGALDGSLFPAFKSDSVSSIDDPADFYKVRLDANSNLNVTLSGVTTSTRVELIRNSNNSRFGDPGESIQAATANSSGSVSMQIEGLARGDYGIRVSTTAGTTNYSLGLAATVGTGREQPDSTSAQPQFLNVLNGSRLIKGSIAERTDNLDSYRIRVDVPTKLEASLFSSSAGRIHLDLSGFGNRARARSLDVNTNVDFLRHDYLSPGNYAIDVVPTSSGNTDYTLNLIGTPIEHAELSIFAEQVSSRGSFGLGDTPDFFVRANIDGFSTKTKTVNNKRSVDFNESLTQSVNINEEVIPFSVSVIDSDGGLRGDGDLADINEVIGVRELTPLVFDALTSTISVPQSNGLRIIASERNTLTVTGNGDGGKAATLKFRADHNTFGFGQTAFSNSTPTTIDSNSSGVTSGRNLGGIVNGRGGRDQVYAKGGDDVAMGGAGNDYVDGGKGDDIIYGGLGRDTCVGGARRDTFVLEPDTGVDIINDFRNGVDKLGLTNAIAFEMLEITRQGKNIVIGLGSEQLAVLKGVRPNQIGVEDFVAIAFTNFKGMEVPIVASI